MNSKFIEADLAKKRVEQLGYAFTGVPMNEEHMQWIKGREAAEAAATVVASQRAEMSGEQLPSNSGLSPELGIASQWATIIPRDNEKSPAKRTIHMYSERRKEWHKIEALFDTGSSDSWIAEELALKLNYSIKTIDSSTYYTFTGATLDSSEIIRRVRWCIDTGTGPDSRSRYADFRIAPRGAPFMVLFGRDRIFSEDIFSFNEANLILTKAGETEVKKAKENKKEQVEAEAQALKKERQTASARSKPTDQNSVDKPKRNG